MEMTGMVYGRVDPEKIDMLSKIIEAYGHLGIVSTLDGKTGAVMVRATPDTIEVVLDILNNLPFPIQIKTEYNLQS